MDHRPKWGRRTNRRRISGANRPATSDVLRWQQLASDWSHWWPLLPVLCSPAADAGRPTPSTPPTHIRSHTHPLAFSDQLCIIVHNDSLQRAPVLTYSGLSIYSRKADSATSSQSLPHFPIESYQYRDTKVNYSEPFVEIKLRFHGQLY